MGRTRPLFSRAMTAAGLACALGVAACGGGPSYGSQGLTNFTPKPVTSPSPSPTPPPPAPAAPAPVQSQAAPAPVAPKPKPPPPAPPPAPPTVTTVTIHDDSAAPAYYDPSGIVIKVGGSVKWVNQDAVARVVKADDGSFASPPIAPGAVWQHTFPAAGSFNYHDQRPYAGGNVTAR